MHHRYYLGMLVDEVLEVLVLIEHAFADEAVEVHADDGHQGRLLRVRQPRHLGRLLEILHKQAESSEPDTSNIFTLRKCCFNELNR